MKHMSESLAFLVYSSHADGLILEFDHYRNWKGYYKAENKHIEVVVGQLMNPFRDKIHDPFPLPGNSELLEHMFDYVKIVDKKEKMVFEHEYR